MTEKQPPSSTDGKTQVSGPATNGNLDSQSVAGEEDPGASLDTSGSLPPKLFGVTVSLPSDAVNPGDEASEGTSGTGEGICRACGGSGRMGDAACPSCKGSGKVIVGIGGA
jgi:hypothetical protein